MSPALPTSDNQNPSARTPAHPGAGSGGAVVPSSCLDSHEILRGQKTVAISHNGSTYRLQATRLGKLILTK